MASKNQGMARRNLLLTGLGLTTLAAAWNVYGVRPAPLDFSPIRSAPGWEMARAGGGSGIDGSQAILLGLDGGNTVAPLANDRLGPVVHGPSWGAPDAIALFTDFFCPFCRVMEARVLDLQQDGAQVTWHHLPLLGAPSEWVARAFVAAELQEMFGSFHKTLLQEPFRPGPRHLGDIATIAGLDAAQFETDRKGPVVAQRLAQTASAAARLGIFATPALVVGQRVVIGEVDKDQMQAVVRR